MWPCLLLYEYSSLTVFWSVSFNVTVRQLIFEGTVVATSGVGLGHLESRKDGNTLWQNMRSPYDLFNLLANPLTFSMC